MICLSRVCGTVSTQTILDQGNECGNLKNFKLGGIKFSLHSALQSGSKRKEKRKKIIDVGVLSFFMRIAHGFPEKKIIQFGCQIWAIFDSIYLCLLFFIRETLDEIPRDYQMHNCRQQLKLQQHEISDC